MEICESATQGGSNAPRRWTFSRFRHPRALDPDGEKSCCWWCESLNAGVGGGV
jgi:hypothetical protein